MLQLDSSAITIIASTASLIEEQERLKATIAERWPDEGELQASIDRVIVGNRGILRGMGVDFVG